MHENYLGESNVLVIMERSTPRATRPSRESAFDSSEAFSEYLRDLKRRIVLKNCVVSPDDNPLYTWIYIAKA